MTNATLIAERLSFKGNTTTLLKFKSQVEDCLNKVGTIEAESFGCFDLKFGKKKIRVPKNWVEIVK